MRSLFCLKNIIYVQFFLGSFLIPFTEVKAATQVSEIELSKVLEKYRDIATLDSKFTQIKKLVDADIQLKSEGHLKLTAPDTIVWQVDKPSKMIVTMKAQEVQIVTGESSSQTTQTFKRGEGSSQKGFEKDLQDLVTWLKFDPHALATEYQITKPQANTYLFDPKHEMVFRHIEMKLAASGYAQEVILTENSGDSLDISFAETKVTHKPAHSQSAPAIK